MIHELDRDKGVGGFDNDRIEEHLIRISDALRHSEQRQKLYCSTFTTDLGQASSGLVLFPGGLHLNDGADIGSVYIENNGSTASINLYEGPSGSGRLICTPIKHGGYKVVTIADAITSISIAASVANDTGLVVVMLYSHRFSPKTGTL